MSRGKLILKVTVMFMEILVFIAVVSSFYLSVRYFLNKHKNYNIPLIPERYHTDLANTYTQMAIVMVAFIVAFIVIKVIYYM